MVVLFVRRVERDSRADSSDCMVLRVLSIDFCCDWRPGREEVVWVV